jgi:hypothetical protein
MIRARSTSLGKRWDADYLTAGIARDHPDILERMKAGKFKSVRQAALEAGIVKPKIQVPHDVEGATRILTKHFSPDEVRALIAELQHILESGSGRV